MNRLPRTLFPGLLVALGLGTVLLALESGGYYPGTTADAALGALVATAMWVLVAPDALRRFGPAAVVVVSLLTAFAAWTLLSGSWSHSPARALTAFDRVLLYLTVLVLFAAVGGGVGGARVRWLTLVAGGTMLAVVVIALAAWMFPDVVSVSKAFERRRMSYPTGYWNATGLLAALAAIWSLHVCSATGERPALRICGAAAIVPCVTVIGLTASRGAVLAALAGAVAYILATRSSTVLVGLLAAAPAAALGAIVATKSTELNTNLFLPIVISEGRHDAALLVVCTLAAGVWRATLLRLDGRGRLIRFQLPPLRVRIIATAVTLIAVLGIGIAAGAPGRISHAIHQFSSQQADAASGTSHLVSFTGDGRAQIWTTALRYGFEPRPVTGSGAGTFPLLWEAHRADPGDIPNAQSLFVETVSELGIVGAVLLFTAFVAIVVAIGRRTLVGGAEGAAWAALLGGGVAWLVFAGVDWDWQLPACTIWLFAAGGLALSRQEPGRDTPGTAFPGRSRRRWGIRVAIALAAILVAWVPLKLERSDSALAGAITDLQHNDCAAAQPAAAASRTALSSRPEPYMVLAVCAARRGSDSAAARYAATAIGKDPQNWETHYILALVLAAAGHRPVAAMQAARAENPTGSYVIQASDFLSVAPPAWLRQVALRLPVPLAEDWCGGPTRANQLAECSDPSLPVLASGAPEPTQRP
jgi:O-Antigen ligase